MLQTPLTIPEIEEKARKIRVSLIETLVSAGSGHTAGPLGTADILATLYFHILKHDPEQPDWEGRDVFMLSNGHICPVLYATLAEAGYFPAEELKTLRKLDSRLQGHPHLGSLPGVENTSGPLGQGLSQAAGLALGWQMDGQTNQVYCMLSDAEHNEGQTWEAYMLAAKYTLANLTVLIDRNNIQIEGKTDTVMPLEPLREKLESFGWHVQEINGHNVTAIIDACHHAQAVSHAPSAIICHTIPGKGVSFMESKYEWHGKPPSREEAELALKELASV